MLRRARATKMNAESYRTGCICYLTENSFLTVGNLQAISFAMHVRSGLINFWGDTDICKCKLVLIIHVKVMLMLKSYSVRTWTNVITKE